MAETKILVIYPRPTDVDAFEKVYIEEHVPLAMEKIKGVTKFAATRVVGTPDGSTPPYHRIAELYFPSMEALQESAASAGTQEASRMRLPFPPEARRSSWWLNRKPQSSSSQPT